MTIDSRVFSPNTDSFKVPIPPKNSNPPLPPDKPIKRHGDGDAEGNQSIKRQRIEIYEQSSNNVLKAAPIPIPGTSILTVSIVLFWKLLPSRRTNKYRL